MLESTIHIFLGNDIVTEGNTTRIVKAITTFAIRPKTMNLMRTFLNTTSIRVRNTRTQGSFFISETKYVRRNVIVSFANFYNRLKKYLLLFQPCYKNSMAILCLMMIVCFRS